MPAQVPILMYHSVADVMTDGFREFTVTPARLTEQLTALHAAGWRTVTVGEAVNRLRYGPVNPDERVVAVSFDDGLADFLAALPLLQAQRARATLFVPTAHVGATARWLCGTDSNRPMLDWAALADVVAAGIELGSHGHLHRPLDLGCADELFQDVARSKGLLEDKLHVRISALAYPFGYQTRRSREAVRRAGYHLACAVTDLPATSTDEMFALPRLAVRQEMSGADVVRVVSRHYDRWERSWRIGKQRVWSAARTSGLRRRVTTG